MSSTLNRTIQVQLKKATQWVKVVENMGQNGSCPQGFGVTMIRSRWNHQVSVTVHTADTISKENRIWIEESLKGFLWCQSDVSKLDAAIAFL